MHEVDLSRVSLTNREYIERTGMIYLSIKYLFLQMDKLIALRPKTLACMHGSAFAGDKCVDMLCQLKDLRLEAG